MADRTTARTVKSQVMATLSGNHRVNGVGIGHRPDGWIVKVNLAEDDAVLRRSLPRELDGVPVLVEVVGTVTARSA